MNAFVAVWGGFQRAVEERGHRALVPCEVACGREGVEIREVEARDLWENRPCKVESGNLMLHLCRLNNFILENI